MRNIFRVDAYIVDANGSYHNIDGYPKNFDSANYQNDVDKARKRAEGDFSEAWGAMCKNDTRMIQTVTLCDISGFQIDHKSMGGFPVGTAE